MTDEMTAKDEAKKQKDQQIVNAYKGLAASGFNKQQAAQQLSAKFAMTVDEVSAVLDQQDEPADKKEKADK